MAARTTAEKVKQILETDLSDAIVEAFINAATELVTKILTGEGLTDALMAEIERWLTAHLIASTREQQLAKAEAGPASATFQGKTGMGLDATLYGQQVKLLDTTGKMAAQDGALKFASMHAVPGFD